MGEYWGGTWAGFMGKGKSGYSTTICLVSSLGIRAESENRTLQMVSYRAGDEPRGLNLKNWREE